MVDKADVTEQDEVYHKSKVVEAAEFKGDVNHRVFIKGEYEASKLFYNKIYAWSGNSPKEAQLGLLEQGCTEFLDIDLNGGTTCPEIYMYYATPFAAKRYNEKAMKDTSMTLSTMPKDYMKSPLTKICFAMYDYVPYCQDLVTQTPGSDEPVAWEYVMKKDYSAPIELNEGAISYDSSHLMSDNRISMFVQREDGSVKRDAEITGGYMTTEVTEKKLSLEK